MTPHAAGTERTSNQTIAGFILACLGAVALALGTGAPVASQTVTATPSPQFTIDLYTVVRDEPGTETPLGSWTVPEELRGQSCVATSTPENNSSIHPGNDLRIASATTITLVGVEGTGDPVSSTDRITLDDQVEVTLIMGPDGVYSAGLVISFDCLATSTTTSTTTTTTTTTNTLPCEWNPELPPDSPECVPPTSTSVATTTTQVGNNPPTTSTTLPCEWDPDLEPDDPACTTTTVEVESNPPTTVTSGANSPATTATELPRTGSTDTMPLLAAVMVLAGGAMALMARRRPI